MITKRVKAWLVSGALVSTIVPGSSAIRPRDANSTQEKQHNEDKAFLAKSSVTKSRLTAPKPKAVSRPTARRHLGHFEMTAYTRYAKSSDRTASGTRPHHQRTVAVDPRVIPLGTKLEIEGIGVRIAEDTGPLIKGKKLDLFLPSVQACTRFGVRSRKVSIID